MVQRFETRKPVSRDFKHEDGHRLRLTVIVKRITGKDWNVLRSVDTYCLKATAQHYKKHSSVGHTIPLKGLTSDGFAQRARLSQLLAILQRWSGNNLHAGTKRQERKLNTAFNKGRTYTDEVEYLEMLGLYNDQGYRYGTSWLTEPLPTEVLQELVKLMRR